jgi:hypothetical protein
MQVRGEFQAAKIALSTGRSKLCTDIGELRTGVKNQKFTSRLFLKFPSCIFFNRAVLSRYEVLG